MNLRSQVLQDGANSGILCAVNSGRVMRVSNRSGEAAVSLCLSMKIVGQKWIREIFASARWLLAESRLACVCIKSTFISHFPSVRTKRPVIWAYLWPPHTQFKTLVASSGRWYALKCGDFDNRWIITVILLCATILSFTHCDLEDYGILTRTVVCKHRQIISSVGESILFVNSTPVVYG